MPAKPHAKALFFDWDGTLVNTIPTLYKSHNRVRVSYGYEPFSMAEFFENVQYSSRELYPRLYGENAEEALARLYDFVAECHLQELEQLPYALNLLEKLHEQNIVIGIISNKKHEYLVREVEHLGWHKYAAIYGGAGYAETDKPTAAPLLKALKHVGLEPADMIYIGDTVTDLKAAQATNCRSALVLNGENKEELLTHYKPDYVVNDCRDLSDLIMPEINENKAC